MSRKLTAADRSALIRLASSMEEGSEGRRAILKGLSKSAATRYEHDGQLMTLAELARVAIGKDVFTDSRGLLNYNIVMDKSGDSSTVFKVTPTQWRRLRLPDLTPPRTREKVLGVRLTALMKMLSMRDRIEVSSWAKKTDASKEEMIAYIEERF